MIMIETWEFWAGIVGWVTSSIFFLLFFACMKLTPAKAFIKAWFSKGYVFWVKNKAGIGEFKSGKMDNTGFAKIKGLGPVMITENSQVREDRSGRPVFDLFSEYGATISQEYGPMIQEIREKGLVVNNFDDYEHYVKLATEPNYIDQYIERHNHVLVDPVAAKKEMQDTKKKLEGMKLEIKPNKTYSFHQLAHMFPSNFTPVYVEAQTEEAALQAKKQALKNINFTTIAMGVLIIIVALVIFLKTFRPPACPACQCMVETAKVAAASTNLVV